MSIGNKIKELRKGKKISQEKLASILGVSQAMIAQYENGKRNPKIETLQKIAKALDMHLFEFMDDEYFDAATDEEPGSEQRELDFLEQQSKSLEEMMQCKDLSNEDKIRIFNKHMIQKDLMAYHHIENAKSGRKCLLDMFFEQLNHAGQEKAIEQVEMLTKIPDYQKTGDFFTDELPHDIDDDKKEED